MPLPRAAVNQVVQLGTEALGARGTPVPANKLIEAWTWTFGDKPATKQFTGSGRKHPGSSELLYEQSAGKIAGEGCFQSLVYPLASVWGPPTPTLHSPSTTAYDWVFKPGLTGAYNPQTYTLQNGDAIDAEQYAYLLFTGWGYSFTRKQELQVSGEWISQTFSDGVSLTASPTLVARQPATGAQADIYLDSTSAGIGGTLITQDALKVDFKASNYYGPYYPINRANASFASHLDLMPKNELKITFAASAAAIAYIATYLRTGARAYIRTDVQGPLADVANSVHFEQKHDMACFMIDCAELSDVDGAYAFETTWAIAEDVAWASGQAQVLTLTNLLSAL